MKNFSVYYPKEKMLAKAKITWGAVFVIVLVKHKRTEKLVGWSYDADDEVMFMEHYITNSGGTILKFRVNRVDFYSEREACDVVLHRIGNVVITNQ